METLFWVSAVVILYAYILYPGLVYLLSLCYKKPVLGKYIYPKVSVLISAYNEEKHIEEKIKNLLALDYPQERIEILIGSDGSTDRTDEIVAKYAAIQSLRGEGAASDEAISKTVSQ